MIKRIFSVAALSLMVAACGGGDEAGEGDVVSQDTSSSVIQGTDTVNQPTVVGTSDTVTAVTTTTVDTTQGQAQTTGTTTTTTTDSAQH